MIGILIAISSFTGLMSPPTIPAPTCWEDEVQVMVTVDLVQDGINMIGTLGCVPADNLPTEGYRP